MVHVSTKCRLLWSRSQEPFLPLGSRPFAAITGVAHTMDPALLGGKLASALVAPQVRKLLRHNEPGAGLVGKPVQLAALVSFRGEKRTLTDKDVHRLAGTLVAQAAESPGEPPFPADETTAVTDALAARLLALGDLDMDDVQAVRLGHRELASRLARLAPMPPHLAADSAYFLDSVTEWACLHILEFFTRRSTFVARTLVEQTRAQAELIRKIDELIARTPRPGAADNAFERRYRDYVAKRHNHITIYGIDLRDSPDRWPLEVAYLSLEATAASADRGGSDDEWWVIGEDGFAPSLARTAQFPAEGVLSEGHRRVLLRGDAGSGKTTLLQWLAVTAARDGDLVPYVLPLRTLVRQGALPPPDRFLDAVSCPHTPPDGWAERVLTSGRGLVLVDGLDEVPAPDRRRARDWLTALVAAFPDNRWLLTSRPTAVRADWLADEGFREIALAPMRPPEVATFVSRWHAAAQAPQFEEQLLDSLRTKRDLARLATNPLMCGLICALHRERRGYLPTGRKELYDAALSMLLARRDRERGMGAADEVELGEEGRVEILQRLGYALVLSGRTEMDEETAIGLVERCLPVVTTSRTVDATTVLRGLLLRTGLLRSPAPGVVDFVHRTFQDYLGARYAVEEGHLDVLVARAGDTQWDDVVRMAVAHARPRERASLIGGLLARHDSRCTLLALACLEHAPALDRAVRTEVELRAGDLIPPDDADAARALAEAGPLVLELLPGPEGLTEGQAHAVAVCASLLADDEPEAALAVLRRFRSCPSLDVRRQLVGTWHRFDARRYREEVLDHVARDELFLTCETEAQLASLAEGPPWPLLHLSGPLPVPETDWSEEQRRATTALNLSGNDLLTDTGWLSGFRGLRRLWIQSCPRLVDLSALAGLPLDNFMFCGALTPPEITALPGVTWLHLEADPRLGGLDASLPRHAPLESLGLRAQQHRRWTLTGLHRWPTLKHLDLMDLDPTPQEWEEIASLSLLTRLALFGDPAANVRDMPVLPRVTYLALSFCSDREVLARFAARLPGLDDIYMAGELSVTDPQRREAEASLRALFPDARINVGLPAVRSTV